MGNMDDATESALAKTNKACRFIGVALKIVFAIFVVFWVGTALIMTLSLVFPGSFGLMENVALHNIVLYVGQGIVIAVMFVAFMSIFSDVSKGETPFTMMQVRRLRLVAGMLVLYGFLDFAVAASAAVMQINGLDSGFVATSGNIIIPINLVPLIAAAVVFAFSFVFKYGVLLQKFSDETL